MKTDFAQRMNAPVAGSRTERAEPRAARRLLAAALCVAVLPHSATAKEAVSPAEAVDLFDQVCLQSAGDKALEEEAIEERATFTFAQSTESQSVAEHDAKNLSFLLLQAGTARTCILNFATDGDLIDSFYAVRALVAGALDVSEADFAEEGAQIIYRSEQQDIVIRPTNGISIAVSYK